MGLAWLIDPFGASHGGAEADIAAQVLLVGESHEVLVYLRSR
ncbi:Uncharacterised protein [Mycobacteroides abscessus subsp. abscessus]|nr:Uncharacterised protein [Mycobacteroides abscessus subsp. abscessus]SKU73552.1 Uncharacterised protein [Mycobacteroides abscessus subsp. abscessus]